MKNTDISLGTVTLTDVSANQVQLRLAMDGDSFNLEVIRENLNVITLHIEDESDVSDLISLLDSCFNFM